MPLIGKKETSVKVAFRPTESVQGIIDGWDLPPMQLGKKINQVIKEHASQSRNRKSDSEELEVVDICPQEKLKSGEYKITFVPCQEVRDQIDEWSKEVRPNFELNHLLKQGIYAKKKQNIQIISEDDKAKRELIRWTAAAIFTMQRKWKGLGEKSITDGVVCAGLSKMPDRNLGRWVPNEAYAD